MMYRVAVDTETTPLYEPFIATTTDQRMDARLYKLRNRKGQDYQELKELCEDRSITKVMHPCTFDIYALSKIGIKVRGPLEDTLIRASLVNENFASRKLKSLARDFLGEDTKEAKELGRVKSKYRRLAKKKGKVFSYDMIPRRILYPYAIEDTNYTMKLCYYFDEPIKPFQDLYDFEKSLIRPIVKIQQRGIMVDRKFANKMVEFYKKECTTAYDDIQQILRGSKVFKRNFNPRSPKQVGYILSKVIDGKLELTKKDHVATSANILETHYGKNPFVKKLLYYRFCNKQRGTYFEPLVKHYTTDDDPYAHFLLWQSGTRTGRFSAELIQTIPTSGESKFLGAPKLARKAFIPRPGYRFVAIDYKAIQMRLFFHFANAEGLIKKVLDGWDPHDATCQMLFNKDPQARPDLRKIAKNTNFGIIFGMGTEKLVASLGVGYKRARSILDKYYRLVPVREYMDEVVSLMFKTGVITTTYDSPLMQFTREYRLPANKAYKGVNMIIQGSEAYVMKYAMMRVRKIIKELGMDAHMLTIVHDEILFEVNKKEPLMKLVWELAQAMEDHVTFKLPMLVDVKTSGKTWGDVHELKDWRKAA